QLPHTFTQGLVIAEVAKFQTHDAPVDGDSRFGIAHLIAPLGEVVASVGVEVVPYLLHV
ncbi:hypothetical protein ISH03_30650, partial [Pseudomonas aeruginosa]|nr:hypothetical protein [Pseudomonas aeruginosa]